MISLLISIHCSPKMAWPLLPFRALLLLWFVANRAWSCSQEDYWKMKLPKVPMPQQIRDTLLSSFEKTSMTKFTGLSSMDTDEKTTTTQPYAYFSRYKADGYEKKQKATTTQPYTVFSWRYDFDEKEKITPPTTTQSRVVQQGWYNAGQKEKVTTTQPYTVFSWRYNVEDNTKEKVTTTQPYTVFSWRYNAEEKEKATTTTTTHGQPRVVEQGRYIADDNKEKLTTTQPYTVFSWRYNAKGAKQRPIHHNHILQSNDDNKQEVDINLSTHTMRDGEMTAGSVFFIEKDLHVGAKLRHDFQKRPTVPLLSSDIAESIPFSMDKYSEILNHFSISPESSEATIIKETLSMCLERPRVKIENRTCAISMESLVDFVVQELGTNDIKATMMHNLNNIRSGIQEYTVTKLNKMSTGLDGNSMVTCHRMNYPYVVYYCHHQRAIGLFSVTLVDSKGVAVDTSAICHYDTYAWEPDVPALRYLNIRPGDSPVCHFSGATDISWTINKSDLVSS